MRKIILIIGILFTALLTEAQQDAMYTHYMFNTIAVNPAYAGSRNVLTVTGIHRSQWVGFKGAPVTQSLTMHSPLFRKDLGVGLSIINDDIGPSHFTTVNMDMSYSIEFEDQKTGRFPSLCPGCFGRRCSFILRPGKSLTLYAARCLS